MTSHVANSAVRASVQFIDSIGEFSLFVGDTIRSSRHIWRRRGLFLRHCEFIGVSSLMVTLVAGIFMGAVLGYQLYMAFHLFGAEGLVGGSVGVSIFKEMAPFLTAVMVAGRAGSAIAAEIASMRISEQIDALEVMAVNPIEYLVMPRVLAGVLMLPFLAIFFGIIASISASLIACAVMDLQFATYWQQFAYRVDAIEMVHTIVKAAAFGLVLTWIACFFGFRAQGGAHSVGKAAQNTVVVSLLMILLTDYILTSLLPFGYSRLVAN